jgi:pimeloyl-ACP methyl ester carboxylesterase
VYPIYQENLRTPVKEFTPNAIAAVKEAIHVLQTEPRHVKPQLDKFAIVGHSMGGVVTANMAATWKEQGLPFPRAVMCVQPGKTWAKSPQIAVRLADLSKIPEDTLLLAVTGDKDLIARDVDAKRIFNESTQVPAANKNYVTLVSDDHGSPPLKASHTAPVAWAQTPGAPRQENNKAGGPLREAIRKRIEEQRGDDDDGLPDLGGAGRTLDALDFYGTWKLFDGLTDAAFYGKNRNYALGGTPEQRFMGTWSDGTAVKELVITEHP